LNEQDFVDAALLAEAKLAEVARQSVGRGEGCVHWKTKAMAIRMLQHAVDYLWITSFEFEEDKCGIS